MRALRILVAGLAVLGLASGIAETHAAATPPAFVDGSGIHVVSGTQTDPRLWALSVSSPALGRAVRLRVLLPAGYDASSATRYPVLYLFHGTSGGPDDWITAGDAEQTTAGLPLIVVLADAGFDNNGGSWFTNWVDKTTKLGPSQWETFHVSQLVPWVDANLDTVAMRAGRAIAGLSQGGFGAMSYAARYPDLFGAAGSFSGAPEIDRDPVVIPPATAIISATAVYLDGVQPDAMFGSRFTNEVNWQGHDAATLLENLRSTNLSMWTATGIPGQHDTQLDPYASAIEFLAHESTMLFHQHLDEAKIPSYYNDYVFGTHTFPYWADDLRAFVPRLMQFFAHPIPAPTTISYKSVEKTYTQWGWSVVNTRTTPQIMTTLSNAKAAGFSFKGRDSATVTTAALYVPGSVHVVKIANPTTKRTVLAVANASGRLSVSVNPRTLFGSVGTSTVTVS